MRNKGNKNSNMNISQSIGGVTCQNLDTNFDAITDLSLGKKISQILSKNSDVNNS